MVLERIVISLAERDGSESDLEIKGDKYDLWPSEGQVGN